MTCNLTSANEDSKNEDSKIKRLVVAVHGIGNQFRYATIQAAASRFMAYCGEKNMTLPLGAFHPEKLVRRPDSPELGAGLAHLASARRSPLIDHPAFADGYPAESALPKF